MATADLKQRLEKQFGQTLPLSLKRKSKSSFTKFAHKLANNLQAGDTVALSGNLGAGKTYLVNKISECLSNSEDQYFTSPTYTIANIYNTSPTIAHLDVYRLEFEDDFIALGGEEYFSGEFLCFVEWAEKIEGIIPKNSVWVHITVGNNNERLIQLSINN